MFEGERFDVMSVCHWREEALRPQWLAPPLETWSQDRLLIGKNGIAALTFCNVPVSDERVAK